MWLRMILKGYETQSHMQKLQDAQCFVILSLQAQSS